MKQFKREHPHLCNIISALVFFAITVLAVLFGSRIADVSVFWMWILIFYAGIYAIARTIAKAKFESNTGADYNKTLMEYYTEYDKQVAEAPETTEVEKPRKEYDDEGI